METELAIAAIKKPEPVNFILGQTHFIKSVEDIHEALVTAVPGIKFGLAFCESSGKCLVRWPGTDPAKEVLAVMQSVTNGVLVSTTMHRDLNIQNPGHYRTLSKY